MNGLTAESTKESGRTIRWKDTAFSHGPTEEDMKVNTLTIKNKEREFSSGKIVFSKFRRPDGRKYDGDWKNGK